MTSEKILITINKALVPLIKYLIYLPFFIPLIYLYPLISEFNNEFIRSDILILAGVVGTIFLCSTYKKSRQLSNWQSVLAIYIAVMVVSSLLSHSLKIALWGLPQDYQGLVLQLASIVVALIASNHYADIKYWRVAGLLMSAVCFFSIISDVPYIFQGYRLSGLFFHDTGVSVFAAVTLSITLILIVLNKTGKYRELYIIGLICSLVVVILSSSRLGVIALISSLAVISWLLPVARKWSLYILMVIIVSVAASYLVVSPVQRLATPDRIGSGIGYRLSLYDYSLTKNKLSLIGLGSSQTYRLYSKSDSNLPKDLRQTLNQGFVIWYSHSQFIDQYVQYGVLGILAFGYLVIASLKNIYKHVAYIKNQPSNKQNTEHKVIVLIVAALFIGMFCDLLVNTPSIELYPIIFSSIFTGLKLKNTTKFNI